MENHPFIKSFGERLRLERKRLGLTQEELAARMGVSKRSIITYENGQTSPPADFVHGLQLLGVNAHFLMFGEQDDWFKGLDFSPKLIAQVTGTVTRLEKELAAGKLSDEIKLRMMLILLKQFVKQPATEPLSAAESLALLAKG